MYLDFIGTQSKSDVWFIDLGAYFHMIPHREWLCEYGRYNKDVFLGDDSTTRITGSGRVKLLLNYGRIKTLPRVLHIPALAIKLISLAKQVMQVFKLYWKKTYAKWFK